MIEQTKQEVEQHYNLANGYQHDAQVCHCTTSITENLEKVCEIVVLLLFTRITEK
jgi:hypothetical protein